MPGSSRVGAGRARTVALAAAAVAALGGALLLHGGPGDTLPSYGPAPAFALTDQLGRTVRSSDLRGRVVVASFLYTACPDVCPAVTARMARLQRRLAGSGRLAAVRLLSVSVDPLRDTPEVLRRYAEAHGAEPEAWRFLTGPEETVRSLVTEGFKLALLPATSAPAPHAGHAHTAASGPPAPVLHSPRVVLIDTGGTVRAYYDGRELDVEQVLRDVDGLLR